MKRHNPELSGPCPGLMAATMEESDDGEYVKADDVIALIRGCFDYGGGYGDGENLEIFHHGIGTVLNAMSGAMRSGKDPQSDVLIAMGRRAVETGVFPGGERGHVEQVRLSFMCTGIGEALMFKNQDGTFARVSVRRIEWLDGDIDHEYCHPDTLEWHVVPKTLLWKATQNIVRCEPHAV